MTMKAIVSQDFGGPITLSTSRSRPVLRPSYILVKTYAVALNPADNLYVEYKIAGPGSLLGCDYAGVVLEVGAEVRKDLKPGDRVCGCAHGGDPEQVENGTFAEVICVKGDLAVRIPEGMSYEDASTTGVTMLTTGICLYQKCNVPFPKLEDGRVKDVGSKRVVFIYGGSSAMGTMLIQFAKLSGFEVWTCCSPKNFDLVKSYGVDKVWDYHDSAAADSVRAAAEKTSGIKLCVDCIGLPPTSAFCTHFLSPGAIYSAITPLGKVDREDVTHVVTMGYSFLGERWKSFYGGWVEPGPEDLAKSAEFATISEKLLAAGLIKPHPVYLKAGGLDGVVEGLKELKDISGQKIVIAVSQ